MARLCNLQFFFLNNVVKLIHAFTELERAKGSFLSATLGWCLTPSFNKNNLLRFQKRVHIIVSSLDPSVLTFDPTNNKFRQRVVFLSSESEWMPRAVTSQVSQTTSGSDQTSQCPAYIMHTTPINSHPSVWSLLSFFIFVFFFLPIFFFLKEPNKNTRL